MKTPWWFMRRGPMAWLLVPVSWIYYLLSRMVYGMRRLVVYTPRRPVICVGNILAGGVGKTPIVRCIASFLNAPVVMRGYKKSKHTASVGDEALMLSHAGIQVHTGNRKANIRLLDHQKSDTPIVMDDGFQNPKIKKTLSIIVFDARIGIGNGFMLPAGPLREGMGALRRADAVIVIGSSKPNPRFKLPDGVKVFYATNRTINPFEPGTKLAAFAGIGYPKKFFDAIGADYRRSFPDHYQYTDSDIEKLMIWATRHGASLVTTEKDWMRLSPSVREKIKFAPLQTVIDNDFYIWLKEKISGNTNACD